QDLAFGAGREILRQPGDLLEQRTAAGIVEPLRRQPLLGGGQPGVRVGAQRRGVLGLVQVHFQCGHRPGPSPVGGGSGVTVTLPGSATTSWPSETGCHAGSSSSVSELTTTASSPRRNDRAWVQVVATI